MENTFEYFLTTLGKRINNQETLVETKETKEKEITYETIEEP